MDNCKMMKFRHKCFLLLLKKVLWTVTVAVVNMLFCKLLFNHEKKPSRNIRLFVHNSVPFMELLQKFYVKATQERYISPTTHQKAFVFGL